MNKYLEQLLEIEIIAKNEPASMLMAERKRCNGRLILSGKRLLFICNDASEPVIDIDLDTINQIGHESDFVDHNVLAIIFLQYEHAKFTVIDCNSWEKEIELQRMTTHVIPQIDAAQLN